MKIKTLTAGAASLTMLALLSPNLLQAQLIAEENFDYANGTDINGQDGGEGWSSSWNESSGSGTVQNSALDLSSVASTHGIASRSVNVGWESLADNTVYLTWEMALTSETYRSFQFTLQSGGTNLLNFGQVGNSSSSTENEICGQIGSDYWYADEGDARYFDGAAETSYTFVLKVTDGGSGDVDSFTLYVLDSLSSTEPETYYITGSGLDLEFDTLRLFAGGTSGSLAGATGTYDSLRVGESWESIAIPEPSTTAMFGSLLALAALALRRRLRKS